MNEEECLRGALLTHLSLGKPVGVALKKSACLRGTLLIGLSLRKPVGIALVGLVADRFDGRIIWVLFDGRIIWVVDGQSA